MASLISNRNSKKFIVFTGLAVILLFFVFVSPSKGPAQSVGEITPEPAPVFGSGESLTPTNHDSKIVGDDGVFGDSVKPKEDAAAAAPIADASPKKTSGKSTADKLENDLAAPAKGKGSATKAKSTADGISGTSKNAVASDEADEESVSAVSGGKSEQYVVMIDAGSTGSRVHIYRFDITVSPPKLVKEYFEMLKPGLSSFDEDAAGASASLNPLLEFAMESVPKSMHGCTPISLKATAGLRLLGEKKSAAILAQIEKDLSTKYPFPIVKNGISIMDGSDEGVYAWITTNYLLGNIGSDAKTPTAAVFDLGGGSTQIVFEPLSGESMIEGEHKYEISFGGRDFILYQYSHLGYGLMQGRKKVNALVLDTMLKDESISLKPLTAAQKKDKTLEATEDIVHPCVPPGVEAKNVQVELDDETYLVNFVSPATSAADAESESTQCKFLVESILNKDLECEAKTCSFNGIYQPSLNTQFSQSSDMFVFSYFYDRLQPLGMPLTFSLEEMKDINKLVCSGSKYWAKAFDQKSAVTELEEEPLWCLDLSFMTALLHTGYDIPLKRELKTAKKIADNELGWCLGASLPLIDKKSGWSCTVTKDV